MIDIKNYSNLIKNLTTLSSIMPRIVASINNKGVHATSSDNYKNYSHLIDLIHTGWPYPNFITEVILNNVQPLSAGAFMGLKNLHTISVDVSFKNINYIPPSCFANISSLDVIEGLTKNSKKLENWNGILSIGDYAFYNSGYSRTYNANWDFKLPVNLRYIGKHAFENLSMHSNVYHPFSNMSALNNLTCIDEAAFKDNERLICHFKLPENLRQIGASAFMNNIHMRAATNNDDYNFDLLQCSNLMSVGNYAFYNCQEIRKLRFANKLTSIGYNTFTNCFDLKEIKFDNILSIASHSFDNCSSLQNVTLNYGGNLSVENDTFTNNKSLTCLTLNSNDLTRIISAYTHSNNRDYNYKIIGFNNQYKILLGQNSLLNAFKQNKNKKYIKLNGSLNDFIETKNFPYGLNKNENIEIEYMEFEDRFYTYSETKTVKPKTKKIQLDELIELKENKV